MRITQLTSIKGIDLAGPSQPLRQVRAVLESLGLDPNRLRTLYRIRFSIPVIYQETSSNDRDEFFLAVTVDRVGFFFVCRANRDTLPAMIIEQSEAVQTPRFRQASFICRPNEQALINRFRTLL